MSDLSAIDKLIKLTIELQTDEVDWMSKYEEKSNLAEQIRLDLIKTFPNHITDSTQIELPVGWLKHFYELMDALTLYKKHHNIEFSIVQAKEKFGQVRVYQNRETFNDYIETMITLSESVFNHSCGVCGVDCKYGDTCNHEEFKKLHF